MDRAARCTFATRSPRFQAQRARQGTEGVASGGSHSFAFHWSRWPRAPFPISGHVKRRNETFIQASRPPFPSHAPRRTSSSLSSFLPFSNNFFHRSNFDSLTPDPVRVLRVHRSHDNIALIFRRRRFAVETGGTVHRLYPAFL